MLKELWPANLNSLRNYWVSPSRALHASLDINVQFGIGTPMYMIEFRHGYSWLVLCCLCQYALVGKFI
jgi:hypothetical protein